MITDANYWYVYVRWFLGPSRKKGGHNSCFLLLLELLILREKEIVTNTTIAGPFIDVSIERPMTIPSRTPKDGLCDIRLDFAAMAITSPIHTYV